jgi:hypothetical protein
MKEFLSANNKSVAFTSQVCHVTLKDQQQYSLKLVDDISDMKQLTEVIAEAAAFRLSETLGINLVPETKVITYQNQIGSLQKFRV